MSFELTGKLIAKFDTTVVSDKFKKREFALETTEEINGNIYTNYAKMQLVQNKCDIIDRFNINDMVKVSFNVKGNKWEKDGKVNYITNLDAWKVEAANAAPTNGYTGGTQQQAQANTNTAGAYNPAPASYSPSPDATDDLPF